MPLTDNTTSSDLSDFGLKGEQTARDAVASGATLVLMSGDKLLGGPQAGLIVGTREAIGRLRKHPMARALRVDKLTLAALEATLALYRDPKRAQREIPALRMLTSEQKWVRSRAQVIATALAPEGEDDALDVRVEPSEATVGGGAFPTARIPSVTVSIGGDVVAIERKLRLGEIPVIARIEDGRLLLDMRTIDPDDDATLTTLLRAALA